MKKRRIIINNDFYNIFQVEPPVSEQDVLDAVDKVAGSQVDAVFLMVPATIGPDSGPCVGPDIVRLYEHPETDPCIRNIEEFQAAGKNPFQMVLERAREKGIELFASFRMNDTHYLDHIFHVWVPQFYYDHLEDRVGEGGSRGGAEFDYRRSAIREHMLGIIREAVERYDVDGIEMDMTRNCMFFPRGTTLSGSGGECAPVMTEFVRQVREMLDKAGKKRGRRLEICVTIPCSLYKARAEGLDVPTWARLGLIDMVALSSPFIAEFEQDVRDAKLKLPGVQVYAGCDRNLGWPGRRVVPMQTYRAMAMNYLRQGADGTYLYNVMDWTMNMSRPPAMLLRHGGQAPACTDLNLIHEVGDVGALEHLDKLYILSRGEPSADKPCATLPVTVPAGGEATLRLTVGDDIAKASAEGRIKVIYLQAVSSDCADYNNYTLRLNSVDLSRQYAFMPFAEAPESPLLFPEPIRTAPLPPVEKVRRHPVRPIDLHMGVNYVTVKSYRDAMTVTDVELAIVYHSR
jgi:hypothetical protein